MMEPKIVSSFYKYVKIDNSLEFVQNHLEFCLSLGLKGRILIGEEGINGGIYGNNDAVERYKQELLKNLLFSDIEFKDNSTNKIAYRKMFVRLRKEIVNSGLNVDLKNTAKFLKPTQLKEMLDKREDIVLVDMRNDYEAKIGKFKNSIVLPMKNFREFPEAVKEIEHLKEKRIVVYCTGGIRCEKASAYLNEIGFKDVSQIKGGILKYGEEFPDTYWEGKCFVFDDRIAIDINKKNKAPLNNCTWCDKPCDDYINCHNLDCDKLFICCESCRENYNKSCSEECVSALKRRKEFLFVE